MSNYTKSTNFATKDALSSGNPLKIVKGTEIDTEFNNIQTAIATKADSGGTTAVANGGTGATTAAGARTNLLPAFASNAGKVLAVNSGATDVEYISAGGVGTVTSVGGTGTVNGITLTGTVTSSGNLTLGGTLANVSLSSQVTGTLPVANGGTGATSLSAAGIVLTSGTQSIAGNKTFTGIVDFTTSTTFITAAGGASFGQATPNGNYALFVQPNGSSGLGGLATQNTSSYTGHLSFTNNTSIPLITFNSGTISSSTQVGSITTNGSITAYVTTSDYRLKENIAPLANAVTRIKQLAPKNFTWKNNPSLGTTEGFIAHELDAVVPDAVFGEKDAVDQDGNPKYQGVDSSILVPLLTAALQEALVRIEALEAKVG